MSEVVTRDGASVLVDDSDLLLVSEFLWTTRAAFGDRKTAYAFRSRRAGDSLPAAMHRLIMGAKPGQIVDHRNGNGLDNRRENLRLCTARENAQNKARYAALKRASGSFLGVTYNRRARLWTAAIRAGTPDENGEARPISLKYYVTALEAAKAYDSAAAHYFGAFAALNFPSEQPAPFDLAELRGTSNLTSEERSAISAANMRRNYKKGEEHHCAVLTEQDVKFIRESGLPAKALAARFGISISHVSRVRTGSLWRDVAAVKVEVPKGKLSNMDVLAIRRALSERVSYSKIAARFGICISTVYKIAHRKRWAHVEDAQ